MPGRLRVELGDLDDRRDSLLVVLIDLHVGKSLAAALDAAAERVQPYTHRRLEAHEQRQEATERVVLALAELQTSEDELVTRTALAALAIAKGQLKFGAILLKWDSSEIDEILDEHFSWSEMYNLAKP